MSPGHDRIARRVALLSSALASLALPASACPSCALGQGLETLAYVMAFMLIPYFVVSGVWLWIRTILGRENGPNPPV